MILFLLTYIVVFTNVALHHKVVHNNTSVMVLFDSGECKTQMGAQLGQNWQKQNIILSYATTPGHMAEMGPKWRHRIVTS